MYINLCLKPRLLEQLQKFNRLGLMFCKSC
jgi:hypothetical protein